MAAAHLDEHQVGNGVDDSLKQHLHRLQSRTPLDPGLALVQAIRVYIDSPELSGSRPKLGYKVSWAQYSPQ